MVAMDKGASRRISKNHFMGIGALPRKLSGVLYVIFGKPACDCTTIGRDDVHRIAPPERAFHPRRACGEQALAPGERARRAFVDVDCTLHRQPPGKPRLLDRKSTRLNSSH